MIYTTSLLLSYVKLLSSYSNENRVRSMIIGANSYKEIKDFLVAMS